MNHECQWWMNASVSNSRHSTRSWRRPRLSSIHASLHKSALCAVLHFSTSAVAFDSRNVNRSCYYKTLVQAFISTRRLDYCNSLFLYGIIDDLPFKLLRRIWLPVCKDTRISRQFWGSFTDYRASSEWILNWLCWCSKHLTLYHIVWQMSGLTIHCH